MTTHLRRSPLLLLVLLAGCEGPAAAPVQPPTAPTTTAAPAEAKKADASKAEDKLTEAELAVIKKLPAEDQPLAIAQMVCPVGEGHLGDPDMGPPIKVTAKGVTFFLCCKGCEGDVKKDPDAVLAKLAALKKTK